VFEAWGGGGGGVACLFCCPHSSVSHTHERGEGGGAADFWYEFMHL